MKTNIAPEVKRFNVVMFEYMVQNPRLMGPTVSYEELMDAFNYFEDKYRMIVDEKSICVDWIQSTAEELLAGLVSQVEKVFIQIDQDDDELTDELNNIYRDILEGWKKAREVGRTLFTCGLV